MQKRLFIRLSSLGDVILATSVLESVSTSPAETHWLVKKEFAELLQGHPRIHRVWAYDKKTGLKGWIRLCDELAKEGFDDVFDLQSSIRTRLARRIWSGMPAPRWKRVSKERWKLVGYFIFKDLWPNALRPMAWIQRHGKLVTGGITPAAPDLRHLISAPGSELPSHSLLPVAAQSQGYYCVMPSSLWPAKAWPESSYLELIKKMPSGLHPVILGTASDEASRQLVQDLASARIPHTSGVGVWNLKQVARALAGARFYVGNDTGLSHLAESVGARAFVLFGPTTPEMGFGPSRDSSEAIGAELWCRPCGKDGRYCFRPVNRYLCMKNLSPEAVRDRIGDALGEGPRHG